MLKRHEIEILLKAGHPSTGGVASGSQSGASQSGHRSDPRGAFG
jgi:hypothetical protein